MIWIAVATALATVLIAIFTYRAARGALQAAEETRKATEGALYASLMAEYGSSEMLAALHHMRNLYSRWGGKPNLAGAHMDRWAENYKASIESAESRVPHDILTNNARRHISMFYRKAARFLADGLLTEGRASDIRSLSGKEVFFEVVLPLDTWIALRLGTDSEAAEFREFMANAFRCGEKHL